MPKESSDQARVTRLERAVAQLAEEIYALSRPEQIEAKGKLELAALVREYRALRAEEQAKRPDHPA